MTFFRMIFKDLDYFFHTFDMISDFYANIFFLFMLTIHFDLPSLPKNCCPLRNE